MAAAALFAVAPPAQAAFVLYQNFQNLALGYDIAGSDPNENFSVATNTGTTGGGFTVVQDPLGFGNKVLQISSVNMSFTGAFTAGGTAGGSSLALPDNATSTIFYRIRREGVGTAPDINFGASGVTTITNGVNNANNFAPQLNVSGGVGSAQNSEFSPRSGGGTENTDIAWVADTYYGIFQVVNNLTNTTQFYYQPAVGSPVLMTATDGVPAGGNMAFRSGSPTNVLANWLLTTGGSAATQDVFYLDDIYVDVSGANLVAPVSITTVPEPTTVGVAGAALCGLLIAMRIRSRRISS